jgi:PAS domain S-box-containing protein
MNRAFPQDTEDQKLGAQPMRHSHVRDAPSVKFYLLATLLVAVAYTITLLLHPELSFMVTPLFFVAVTLASGLGGLWPGLFATALSLLTIQWLIFRETPPVARIIGLTEFCFAAVLVSVLSARSRRSEQLLRRKNLESEVRVRERTEELAAANVRLEREVVERARAEEVLRASEERFRALFEEAPIGLHEIDRDGVLLRVNAAECALLGYNCGEIEGRPVWELVAAEEKEQSRKDIRAKISGQKAIVPFVREYVRRDGRRIAVEIHEKLIRDQDDNVQGIRSALLDITERRRIEDELRNLTAELEARVRDRTHELMQSNEALQQFAYSASHDLQEPLRMVTSYAKLLEKRYQNLLDDDGREFLFYVVDGGERMSRLIKDLLEFSRAATNDTAVEEFDMSAVLHDAIWNLQSVIEETGANVTSDELPRVRARRAGLTQVLQNLLSNALKYRSEAAPRIHVCASQSENEWIFCVRDNGLGFDQANAARAFGIFQRLHGRHYAGTGMGLAISKRIIQRYGGRIWAESEQGQGSSFFFTLPLEPPTVSDGSGSDN